MLSLRQGCLATASVDHQADEIMNEQLSGRKSSIEVCRLDTDKTDVEEKRVQRSGGHFDLLGMQIFLYKGQMFAERSFVFFQFRVLMFHYNFCAFSSAPFG